jgi:hypothetical protein
MNCNNNNRYIDLMCSMEKEKDLLPTVMTRFCNFCVTPHNYMWFPQQGILTLFNDTKGGKRIIRRKNYCHFSFLFHLLRLALCSDFFFFTSLLHSSSKNSSSSIYDEHCERHSIQQQYGNIIIQFVVFLLFLDTQKVNWIN